MHRFNATFVFIMSIVAFIAFLILFGLSFAGCGTMNAYTSAALVTAGSDYEGAKKNLQDLDDIKFKAWVDMAATIPAGALQRNNTGNPNAVRAVLLACPIRGVGIIDNDR